MGTLNRNSIYCYAMRSFIGLVASLCLLCLVLGTHAQTSIEATPCVTPTPAMMSKLDAQAKVCAAAADVCSEECAKPLLDFSLEAIDYTVPCVDGSTIDEVIAKTTECSAAFLPAMLDAGVDVGAFLACDPYAYGEETLEKLMCEDGRTVIEAAVRALTTVQLLKQQSPTLQHLSLASLTSLYPLLACSWRRRTLRRPRKPPSNTA